MTGPEPRGDAPALSDATRQRMEAIRRGLLRLHKALLDSERAIYEQEKGRVSPGELLQLLIQDSEIRVASTVSEMVILIDEMLEIPADSKESPAEQDGAALLEQVRQLLKPTEEETGEESRYYKALQRDPAAVLAHAEVSKLLPTVSEA